MRTSRAVLGVIAGIAAGAIIGMLMAPDSGENTRKKIASKSMGAVDDMKSKFNSAMNSVVSKAENVVSKADNLVHQAEDMIASKTNKVDSTRKITV